jgi:hypothetical protein
MLVANELSTLGCSKSNIANPQSNTQNKIMIIVDFNETESFQKFEADIKLV